MGVLPDPKGRFVPVGGGGGGGGEGAKRLSSQKYKFCNNATIISSFQI